MLMMMMMMMAFIQRHSPLSSRLTEVMAVSLTDGYFTGPYKNALDKGNAAEKTGEDFENFFNKK